VKSVIIKIAFPDEDVDLIEETIANVDDVDATEKEKIQHLIGLHDDLVVVTGIAHCICDEDHPPQVFALDGYIVDARIEDRREFDHVADDEEDEEAHA